LCIAYPKTSGDSRKIFDTDRVCLRLSDTSLCYTIEYFSGITTCLGICYAQSIVLEMMMIYWPRFTG
jgi:hypothetical protein